MYFSIRVFTWVEKLTFFSEEKLEFDGLLQLEFAWLHTHYQHLGLLRKSVAFLEVSKPSGSCDLSLMWISKFFDQLTVSKVWISVTSKYSTPKMMRGGNMAPYLWSLIEPQQKHLNPTFRKKVVCFRTGFPFHARYQNPHNSVGFHPIQNSTKHWFFHCSIDFLIVGHSWLSVARLHH